MTKLTRREALKRGALGATGLALTPFATGWAPAVPRTRRELVFRPYPHPLMPPVDFAYATDAQGDPFTTFPVEQAGVVVTGAAAQRPFAVNARWFIEGFGFVWLEADNGGRLFTQDDLAGSRTLNLNVEFARTRVARSAATLARYRQEGATFSTEVRHLHDLAQALLEDAQRQQGDAAARLADQSLLYALWAEEKIELEKARSDLARMNDRAGEEVFFGCETRQYVWAKSETMVERFVELFNFATVTHYVWDSWYEVFEPREGEYRWGIKDNIVDWLVEHDITVEGRPILWFHPWVTPDWLKSKTFAELKQYVVNHTEALVGHYGDKVLHWEVVNEYHDWANVHRHTPEQITEVVRLACETTHDVNPQVSRLINNCCPFGTYAAYGRDASGEAPRPLRTPRQFVADLVEAEVPFEVVGVQVYFPERSLADIVRLVERFAAFGKPIYITEIGASSGPRKLDIMTDQMEVLAAPYDWHRPWDEDLQADWLEQVYTLFYSKPYIQAINWYDFADFRTFIPNGGLIQVDGTRKPSFERLKALLAEWNRLPGSE
jgi:endo-1,4-beta-xylanase